MPSISRFFSGPSLSPPCTRRPPNLAPASSPAVVERVAPSCCSCSPPPPPRAEPWDRAGPKSPLLLHSHRSLSRSQITLLPRRALQQRRGEQLRGGLEIHGGESSCSRRGIDVLSTGNRAFAVATARSWTTRRGPAGWLGGVRRRVRPWCRVVFILLPWRRLIPAAGTADVPPRCHRHSLPRHRTTYPGNMTLPPSPPS